MNQSFCCWVREGLLTLFVITMGQCPNLSVAAIPQSERDTLIALYIQTSGNSWYQNTNWCDGACPSTGIPTFNAPGTECPISGMANAGWYGVECDDEQAHVVLINLIDNNLSGTLPSLSPLTSLTMFYAYNDFGGHLNGSIPSLTGMTQLQYFEVDKNQFSGSIPDLSGLTALQSFSASQNQLTGPIPDLTDLTSLLFFDVASNQLTGSIPTIAGMGNLQIFYVNNNQLTGNIPTLAGLTNLSSFNVSHNQLSGAIPDLTGLNVLGYIRLAWNQLTGTVPHVPGNLGYQGSSLCPNYLDTNPSSNDTTWNAGTGYTPWWADPYPTNQCDDLFTDGFEF